jgi:hypothetical protein
MSTISRTEHQTEVQETCLASCIPKCTTQPLQLGFLGRRRRQGGRSGRKSQEEFALAFDQGLVGDDAFELFEDIEMSAEGAKANECTPTTNGWVSK